MFRYCLEEWATRPCCSVWISLKDHYLPARMTEKKMMRFAITKNLTTGLTKLRYLLIKKTRVVCGPLFQKVVIESYSGARKARCIIPISAKRICFCFLILEWLNISARKIWRRIWSLPMTRWKQILAFYELWTFLWPKLAKLGPAKEL